MGSSRDRIAKLLRRAARHPDTEEGKTCAELARKLMDKHRIVVEFDDVDDDSGPVSEEFSPTPWFVVGIYEAWDGWRHSLALTVSQACGCQMHWHTTVFGLASLSMSVTDDDREHLAFCVDYFRSLEALVEQASVPTSVPVYGMGVAGVPVDASDPSIVGAFRRGLADAIAQRLRPPFFDMSNAQVMDVNITQVVEESDETALVRVSSFRVVRDDVPPTQHREVTVNDESKDVRASEFHKMVYRFAVSLGHRMPVHRPRRASGCCAR